VPVWRIACKNKFWLQFFYSVFAVISIVEKCFGLKIGKCGNVTQCQVRRREPVRLVLCFSVSVAAAKETRSMGINTEFSSFLYKMAIQDKKMEEERWKS